MIHTLLYNTLANVGFLELALILVATFAIPSIYFIVARPKFGVIVLIVLAYIIMWIIRFNVVNYPLGTIMDLLQALLLIGFFIKQKYNPDWSSFKEPIGIMILIWVGYNISQFANPEAASRLSWLYTIRSAAIVMLMYFVFSYHIKDIKFVRLILKLWIGLAFFAALYGFKQEHIGFFGFEEKYLNSNISVRRLLFINGRWRKFSIFSDPISFSYNMVTASIFCITMFFAVVSIWKKTILVVLTCFFLTAMLYSGTRGSYVLVPAAMLLFAVLNFNRKVLIFTICAGIFLFGVINMPTSSPTIRRFQTAFSPTNDASFNLRSQNQKRIQPYIQSHPFGGGLGATGLWGARFAPDSFLASFPPDSGYVRVAVELGWVGLFIFCTLMFVILKIGIDNFYRIKDPELKSYCLAMTLILFAYIIGNYPQEALTQFPSNVYFFMFVALITITNRIDKQQQKDLAILAITKKNEI